MQKTDLPAPGAFSRLTNSLGLLKNPAETRVVVAMSGGVDSSVAAAMLVEEGYQVIGVTLQLYRSESSRRRTGACCAGQDIYDAKDVASRLRIPHYVLDYEERFKELVIRDFASSYASGETPIPCVLCNQKVKFADLLDTAVELGADVLATGHYARLIHDDNGPRLYRAADESRDQSYFLFATTSEQLTRLRFPLGGMMKSEVRELAAHMGLSVADKRDSQDICFVPSGRYADVVKSLRPEASREGEIVDCAGRILGRHEGIIHYTIGQRKGLGLAHSVGTDREPLFVVHIDAGANRIVVGPRSALAAKSLELRDVNWIGAGFAGLAALSNLPSDGLPIAARLRSTRKPSPALLFRDRDRIGVRLAPGEEGAARGQACVFYSSPSPDAQVLGGGFIQLANAAAPWAGGEGL